MNCQQFEEILVDLANDRLKEDRQHVEALTHSRSCVRCAFRLEEESALSALLRKPDLCVAPAHLEEKLLAAYRRQFRTNPSECPPRRYLSNRLLAVAASFLLTFLGLTSYMLLHMLESGVYRQSKYDEGRSVAPQIETGLHEKKREGIKQGERAPYFDSLNPATDGESARSEIASDFIPLTSGAELAMMEGGQIVRVVLPRTAMAYYGLPMNQERLNVPVRAQVLIGHDGVARAIRFLNEWKSERIQPEPY